MSDIRLTLYGKSGPADDRLADAVNRVAQLLTPVLDILEEEYPEFEWRIRTLEVGDLASGG